MRIGILTLPLHTNYGGILQAYALQTVLERRGQEVEIIDGIKFKTRGFRPLIKYWIAKILVPLKLWKILDIFKMSIYAKTYYTNQFIKKYIHVKQFQNIDSLTEQAVDAIVVGSDQVWRAEFFGEKKFDKAFLSFTKGWKIKRIAYAASFGSDEWEVGPEMTSKCKEAVSHFDAVSVREKSGIIICKNKLNVKAVQLIDPTLLLKSDDYDALLANRKAEYIPFIMSYIIDSDDTKSEICCKLSTILNMPIVSANSRVEDTSGQNFSLAEQIQPPVEDWLNKIRNADFVITDSFHACLFSIVYQKQFYVTGNQYRGMARFQSILEMLGLQDRLIYDLNMIDCNNRIDYSKVNSILKNKINESTAFIHNYLIM